MFDSVSLQAQDEFKERFTDLLDRMEPLVLELSNNDLYENSIIELFRMFHSLKALSTYLSLTSGSKIFKSVEDVLGLLRYKKPPIRQQIIDWLFVIYDHLYAWHVLNESSSEYVDYEIDSYTLNAIKVSATAGQSPHEILRSLSILVYEPQDGFIEIYKNILSKKAKRLTFTNMHSDALQRLSSEKDKIDFLIFDIHHGLDALTFLKEITEIDASIPVLFLYRSADDSLLRLSGHTSHNFLMNHFSIDDLESIIYSSVQSFFGKKTFIISEHEIASSIDNIKSLPKIILQLQNVTKNEKNDGTEITKIIQSDPILSAKILKEVGSSNHNEHIISLQQAHSLMGGKNIAKLSLNSYENGALEIDLEPYEMTREQFYEVSKKRLKLMTLWYSKVSFSKLPLLTTSALLGNIGQIFIAKKIKELGLVEEFVRLLQNTNYLLAESELLETTTENITADIFTNWGLDGLLSDSIRYSFDITSAPHEAKPFAIANYVVFNTISTTSPEIEQEKVNEMCDLIKDLELDLESYLAAVESISK